MTWNKGDKAHQGYFRAYHNHVVKQTFLIRANPGGSYSTAMREDFIGYLQADGYGGYGLSPIEKILFTWSVWHIPV